MHLLLIEDHRDIAANIAEYFEARGDTVEHAVEGLRGLQLALGNAYDARGQLERAADEYRASLDTAPQYLSTWNNLALVYERSGADRELTVRTWQRVLDLARAQGSALHAERAGRHLRALSSGAAPPR